MQPGCLCPQHKVVILESRIGKIELVPLGDVTLLVPNLLSSKELFVVLACRIYRTDGSLLDGE